MFSHATQNYFASILSLSHTTHTRTPSIISRYLPWNSEDMLLWNQDKKGKKEQVKLHLHGIHNKTECNRKTKGSGPTLLILKMLFKE